MKTLLFILSLIIGTGFVGTSFAYESENASVSANQMKVENGLRSKILIKGDLNRKWNILERMKYYKVPGVSIAVVNEGKIEWVHGYGNITNDINSRLVDEHTLFQAGSISKSLTAIGALLLVQQGKISLDQNVNSYLKRWKVPENEFTKMEKVTLRRLLSHSAGTTVHGFPGYSVQATIPGIVNILEGKKPIVNTGPVRVESTPGTESKYSGGGTTIVQLLIEDITGEHFDTWMQNNVLKPLEMSESTFIQPLPASYASHAAYGHHANGAPIKGKWHIYPEMAAAGLWTTPTDLAKFIVYIQSALKDENKEPLHTSYVKQMITRQKIGDKEIDTGLGLFLQYKGKNLQFSHNGQDEGFIATLNGFAFLGEGLVIMMNNDAGWILMDEISNSVADVYDWPGSDAIVKGKMPSDPASFINFVGKYVNENEAGNETENKTENEEIAVQTSKGKLFIDLNNGLGPLELKPSGSCTFFLQIDNFTIEFLDCGEKSDRVVIIDSKKVKKIFRRKK